MTGTRSGRWFIASSAVIVVAVIILVEPVAQDPAYHLFADGRRILGTPNFWNVMSNLPFLFVGIYGLIFVARHPDVVFDNAMRWPWRIFFVGAALTAFGSGYYHLAPANETLLWDRLTMTIGFAAFLAIVIGEYLSVRAARMLLLPLLIISAASVVYWHLTEAAGNGDLRPYAIVQFLPIVLIPAILIMHRQVSDLTNAIWILIGFYVAAKLLEHFDVGIYTMTGVMSGHALKHVVAALAPAVLIVALRRRREERRNPVNTDPR
jgi:hypothetical protein